MDAARTLQLMGFSLTETDEGYELEHPVIEGATIWVRGNDIIPSTPIPDFRGGDILDFILWRYPEPAAAAERLWTQWLPSNARVNMPELTKGLLVSDLEARLRETTFWSILATQTEFHTKHTILTPGAVLMRKLRLSVAHQQRGTFIALGGQLSEHPMLADLQLNGATCFLVTPFYSRFNQVAAVEIRSAANPANVQRLWLTPARHAYANLNYLRPGKIPIYTHDTLTGQQLQEQFSVDARLALPVLVNQNGHEDALRLTGGVIAAEPDLSNLARLIYLRQFDDEISVCSARHVGLPGNLQVMPLDQYLPIVMEEDIKSMNLTQIAKDILSAAAEQAIYHDTVLNLITKHRPMFEQVQLRHQLLQRQEFVFGTLTIRESEDGYLAIASRRRPVRFTNFTVKITRNVWMHNEAIHQGTVTLNGLSAPFWISQGDIGKVGDIIAVLTAQFRGAYPTHSAMPTILDPSHKNRLGSIINNQASCCETVDGIGLLGWTGKNTAFQTPSTIYTNTMASETTGILNPIARWLQDNYRSTAKPPLKGTIYTARSDLNLIYAMWLGYLERGYHSMDCPRIHLQISPGTQAVATCLMYLLGQSRVIPLPDNPRLLARKMAAETNRYPLVVTPPSSGVITESSPADPLIVLDESMGFVIGAVTDEEMDNFLWTLHVLTQRLVSHLQNEKPMSPGGPASVQNLLARGRTVYAELMDEGLILEDIPYTYFLQLLAEIPAARLRFFIRINPRRQDVTITHMNDLRFMQTMDRERLRRSAPRLFQDSIDLVGDDGLRMPLVTWNEIANLYFGAAAHSVSQHLIVEDEDGDGNIVQMIS